MIFAGGLRKRVTKEGAYSFSMDTSVALIIAKTLSPSLRFIRWTEPVVIIDVTFPAAVWMTSSDMTLSETIFAIVPGSRFRMLVFMVPFFIPALGLVVHRTLGQYIRPRCLRAFDSDRF